jgi:hypothetical protein
MTVRLQIDVTAIRTYLHIYIIIHSLICQGMPNDRIYIRSHVAAATAVWVLAIK